MTVKANTFEGGTNGTTITTANSGGTSGTALDLVTIGTGASVKFDSTVAAHGTLSAKCARTTTGTALSYIGYNVTATTFAVRFYIYLTANPSTTMQILNFLTSGSATCFSIQIISSGILQFVNGAAGLIEAAPTALPLNQWIRVEVQGTLNSSTGSATYGYWTTPDSNGTPTFGNTKTAINTRGAPATLRYGLTNTGGGTNVGINLDDIGYNDTGVALGPTGTPPATAAAGAAQLINA